MSRRHLGALVALAVVLSGAAAPAAGSSPPEAVCGVCGDAFAYAIEDHTGVAPELGESSLRIDVGADGSARFEARVAVTGGAEALRGHPDLREAVRAVYDSGRTVVDDPRDLSVAFEGRTLVVTFRVPDAAHRSVGGVVLFDLLGADPGPGYRMDADRTVVAGPEGTVVVNDPPEATLSADGRRAAWTGDYLGTGTYLAFGEGGPASWAAGQLAVAAAVGPLVASHAAAGGWPHILGVAVAVGLAVGAGRLARRREVPTTTLGVGVAGLGVAAAVLGAGVGGLLIGRRQSLAVVGVGVLAALLGGGVVLRDRLGVDLRSVVGGGDAPADREDGAGAAPGPVDGPTAVAVLALGVALASVALAGPKFGTAVATQVALAGPLGYVAARPGRRRALGVATLAYAVPTAGVVLSVVPVGGFGPTFLAALVGVGAVLTLLAGLPLLALGAVLGAEGATDGETPDRPEGPVIR